MFVQRKELGIADVGADFLRFLPKEDVPVKLDYQRPGQLADFGGDAALVMAAVLTEQLAPVRPHAQPQRVLQRGRLCVLAARHADKPAYVLLLFQHRFMAIGAHVALDGLVLKVVSHKVIGRPPRVNFFLHGV